MPRDSRSYRKRSRSTSRDRSSKKRRSRSRSIERRSRRSRSRERKRSRSRDRSQKESKDRKRRSPSKDKDHSKKKEKSRRSKSKSQSPEKRVTHREGALSVKDEPISKEEEQKHLEEEMQKRRERIEKWRQERKKQQELIPINFAQPSKKWTLEDDEDEDEEEVNNAAGVDEDIDPLDAYMQTVNDEVKTLRDPEKPAKESEPKQKVQFVTAVVKKKADPAKHKGELMESNIDAMEYSSEEEEEDLDSAMANMVKKRKELTVVNHEKIYYAPFRKNFYVEVPEIANMTPAEVEQLRNELEGIKVRGKNCPKPIYSWAHCGVNKKVMDALKKHNYERPTPIQAQAIPAVMSGRDLIGIAKTGSGKTLAFVLPMLRHILDQPPIEEGDGPVAVIMTPTRELALQITTECRKFTKPLGLHVVCVYGGTGISEQIAELKRGCEVIVCTPGRMIDMLSANSGRVTNLRRCTYVVLDEADRMFDMGFEPQVMRIIDNIRPDRQTVMFSATFPRQMEALARRILNKPIEVQVGGRSVVCRDVNQNVIVIEEDKKLFKLLELLGIYQEQGSALVFVDKQEHADELMKMLMKHAYPCMALHGGIDQYDRDSTILDFKNGIFKVLVATSVAARGLDVKHLILVVNYDCPNHYEDYVHRCGRTGRAGNKGFAYTFITPEQERYAGEIIRALELSEAPVPEELNKLWNEYRERAKAEGRTIKSSSGFKGKGFKFDEMEAQLADDRKKLQKAALGLQDSDDEDAGLDIEQKIEDMFASRKRVTDVAKPVPGQMGPPIPGMMGPPGVNMIPAALAMQGFQCMVQGMVQTMVQNVQNFIQNSPINNPKMELARRLAAKINIQKNLGPEAQDITQQAAAAIMKGGSIQAPQVASKTIAEQKAEKINAKLGYKPPSEENEESEMPAETFKRYEEELDINDFPQTARWKVTSKDALAQICEYSEAGITVRGTYVPPGKEPKEGERRLYLAIEATNELAISKAKKEITRLIKEELVRLQNSYQPINKGRYKVL
ncbi:probable ATP-dependent RNA helicase DDX46 [Pomacea canaliculata]|uniref:probable ATP-dependent RNA helicase DDX46 n=1 Tax=Pomacea canaliculata TaxID=400727 RepID=UPI000D73628E|nr:probable ATP-dependent RNA helicase DDX46 [Pomacea canaliculata]